jgi:hypothetical protein
MSLTLTDDSRPDDERGSCEYRTPKVIGRESNGCGTMAVLRREAKDSLIVGPYIISTNGIII